MRLDTAGKSRRNESLSNLLDGDWCCIFFLASGISGCADDPGLPKGEWVGHAGDAYGLRSGLWIDRNRKVGMAYFVTGLPDTPATGKSSFTAPEEEMVRRARQLIGRTNR